MSDIPKSPWVSSLTEGLSSKSSCLSRATKYPLCAPPPPRITSSMGPLGRIQVLYAATMDCTVSSDTVATISRRWTPGSQGSPDAPVNCLYSSTTFRAYCTPKASLPVDLGGRLLKYSWDIRWRRRGRFTVPEKANRPSVSMDCLPLVNLSTTASTTMLPGPVSKAMTSSGLHPGGRYVRLAIPPMFCTILPSLSSLNRTESAKGTRGAPWPPWAMSAGRKSPTVTSPVIWAITEMSLT